ncbi:MAG: NAD(P)/FAD-dependent oxidoreductase [Actinomycetota bacterium]|nr:NAD(P)/FAD-dependent oxidoreductase [Actinomycetota bacterium]
MPGIVIIGAGFSGIGMAIALKKAGFDDFVILEKSGDLGGTWHHNQYPGCACDVPSPLYSYSFELNPSWSRMFAPRQEIWDYLRMCARKYGVDEHIRYGCTVEHMDWDDDARRWNIATRQSTGTGAADSGAGTAGSAADSEAGTADSGAGTADSGAGTADSGAGGYRARAVVSAAGALHLPSFPDLPGTGRFGGPSFHSAQWDRSVDLDGKRIAVIGTGASAIQFIPQVAQRAQHLDVFQRTPPWIHPRPDAPMPARLRDAFEAVPVTARMVRDAIYVMLEARALGFTVNPKLMAPLEQMARRHLEKQITDPELRASVTPDYTIGCKRILLSSDYYPALQRPNVDLITSDITGITENDVITADGISHETDVIIYATGFQVVESVTVLNVTGRAGRKLTPETLEAYHGITMSGFPNFFMLLGPNTGLGHTSVVFMIESQVQHVMSCLRRLARDNAATIEVREPALRHYNDALHRRLRRAVWSEGGCTSWYLDAEGINRALWPGFSFEYWARTRRARRSAYTVSR